MRGLLFTGFTAWVEATRGIEVLDELLTQSDAALSTAGAYTSVGNYPSAELHILADALASREGVSEGDILVAYGQAAFPILAQQAAAEVAKCTDLLQLLSIIESVIHTQVRKLHADAKPPHIAVRVAMSGELEVTYSSHRDFTYLCRGLILGAAQWFEVNARVRVESQATVGDLTTATLEISGWRHA